MKVAVVEKQKALGGTCLIWGCIPTKALLEHAHALKVIRDAKEWGVTIPAATPVVDMNQVHARKDRIVTGLTRGVEFLFKKNKITLFPGTGTLTSKTTVEVKGSAGTEALEAKAIILATGSQPKSLPGVSIDEKIVISSNGAVRNETKPASMIVIGAGAVGMEFADVYAAYGTQVTVLEALDRVLPVEDAEASALVARLFGRRGITIKTGVKVSAVKPGGPGVIVETTEGRIEAEQVLMAVGRGARTAGVGLEGVGVQLERGFVKVSPLMETSVKGIYAVGDMAGAPLLAHKAMAEGVVAAEAIAGKQPRPIDYSNVPSCTYCRPQVASIGFSEAKARENSREVMVGKFPFTANGKAVALGDTDGFVKVIADKASGEILGVSIVGPEATEMIHEFAVGRTLEATVEEIMHTIHAHPTLSEAALEATLAALGQAIHI
jgi:dihydrolipoamide dehydrogenase